MPAGPGGGVGGNVRASGSYIRGTNGYSNGLVPMLRNFNETARRSEGTDRSYRHEAGGFGEAHE